MIGGGEVTCEGGACVDLYWSDLGMTFGACVHHAHLPLFSFEPEYVGLLLSLVMS
jgi:hypothetical protein